MKHEFSIAPGSSVPIYQQIVDQVRLAVASGKVAPGEALPSIRSLAEQLLINPNTVAKAYNELGRDGIAESRPGAGLFVSHRRRVFSNEERERRLAQALDALFSEAIGLDCQPDDLRRHFESRLASWNGGAKRSDA